jgi:hypothetical protein
MQTSGAAKEQLRRWMRGNGRRLVVFCPHERECHHHHGLLVVNGSAAAERARIAAELGAMHFHFPSERDDVFAVVLDMDRNRIDFGPHGPSESDR